MLAALMSFAYPVPQEIHAAKRSALTFAGVEEVQFLGISVIVEATSPPQHLEGELSLHYEYAAESFLCSWGLRF